MWDKLLQRRDIKSSLKGDRQFKNIKSNKEILWSIFGFRNGMYFWASMESLENHTWLGAGLHPLFNWPILNLAHPLLLLPCRTTVGERCGHLVYWELGGCGDGVEGWPKLSEFALCCALAVSETLRTVTCKGLLTATESHLIGYIVLSKRNVQEDEYLW